jgi:flagellar basal body-associated protein FliL
MSITVAVIVLVGIAVGAAVYFFEKKSATKAASEAVVAPAPVVEPTEPKVRPIDEPKPGPGGKLP